MTFVSPNHSRRGALALGLGALAIAPFVPFGAAQACLTRKGPPAPPSTAKIDARVAGAEAAIRARDIDGLLRYAVQNVRVSYAENEGSGHDALRQLFIAQPHLWDSIGWALRTVTPRQVPDLCSPPRPDSPLEYSFTAVALAAESPAREAPSSDARILALQPAGSAFAVSWTLPYEASQPAAKRSGWVELRTGDGRRAYVDARAVRHERDYIVNFALTEGGWRLSRIYVHIPRGSGAA